MKGSSRTVPGATLSVILLTACGTPDAVPWTRSVPEGVRRIVLSPVADQNRHATIRLVRELVIGERHEADFEYLFGKRAPQVGVDAGGRMYVADPTNRRVQVFDAAGRYVRTIGRAGEGPGEFAFPLAAIVAGDRLYVSDTQRSRLSRWSLDGRLEWDRAVNVFPGYYIPPVTGLPDGSWLARFRIPRTSTEVVVHMSRDGEKLNEFAPIEVPGRVAYPPDGPGQLMIYVGATPPTYAADSDGHVYVSPLDEYQVFAYDLDGSMRWALQVPLAPSEVAEDEKEWATDWFREQRYPRIGQSDIDWPELAYALADIKVDGSGRIWVFPYVPRGLTVDRLPVDIYAADGSRILAGWLEGDIDGIYWLGGWKPGPMLGTVWQTARGDHVFGVVEDPETGVHEVVRHRIEFPDGS